MANFLDEGSGSSLADVLGAQADTAATGVTNEYAKRKRKEAAIAGSTGRLNSGVQNYTVADTNASELGDLGNVYGGLATALGNVTNNDYLTNQQDARDRELAMLVASLNKPSSLASAMGMAGSAINLGTRVAGAFGGGR